MSSAILQNNVFHELKKTADPYVDYLMTQIESQLELQKTKPGYIPTSRVRQESDLKEARKFLTKWLTAEEDRHLMSEAMESLFTEASNLPDGLQVKEELQQAGLRLAEKAEDRKGATVFGTIQEWLGISHEIMQKIYTIGCQLFEKMETKKALSIFVLLTNFNAYIFEPWLALGISYKSEKEYFPALHALSMASLVDLANPAPHLYSAEIYLQVGQKEVARQTLEYCLSVAAPGSLQNYQEMINNIRGQF